MAWVIIVAALSLIQYIMFSMQVGKARMTYKVEAPAVTGDPVFERYYRVQMNTLESLIVFLPALFLFANTFSTTAAAGLGVVFIIGRQLYARSYVKDPKTRGLGFMLTILPSLIMVIGALIAAALSLR